MELVGPPVGDELADLLFLRRAESASVPQFASPLIAQQRLGAVLTP